jgi:hypothetical protein
MFRVHTALVIIFLVSQVVMLAFQCYVDYSLQCQVTAQDMNPCLVLRGVHDIFNFIYCASNTAIYVIIVYVLYPKHNLEDQEIHFLTMLGFRDYDDLKEALVQDVPHNSNSRELFLAATLERIRVLMKQTRFS